MFGILRIFLIVGSLAVFYLEPGESKSCPKPKDPDLIRVGETRFFIHHHKDRKNKEKFTSFDDAKRICTSEDKLKMKMPKIDNMLTLVTVGRPLETIVAKQHLQDTWYWLDAEYDYDKEHYYWRTNPSELSFGTFHFRFPRPTGVGGHVDWHETYLNATKVRQCLTLALPWPVNDTTYGHSTSLGERACEGVQRRHAMCESQLKECNPKVVNPYRVTEESADYFYDGNWIFGNRTFVVNWKPRRQKEAKAYCEGLDMQLYTPNPSKDVCLIPFLKMWAREVTKSQWWTSWKYKLSDGFYRNAKGEKVANTEMGHALRMNHTEKSSRTSKDFCVAASHEYEFSLTQTPCAVYAPRMKCPWHFVDFVPANCDNFHGTICQHKDHAKRECNFLPGYTKDIQWALKQTALVPFAWDQNTVMYRSTYKQVFGSLFCPRGGGINFRMLRKDSNNQLAWLDLEHSVGIGPPTYKYDLLESYWVVDEEGFNKTESSLCTISKPKSESDTWNRRYERVPCNEWHFYMCEQVLGGLKLRTLTGREKAPDMSWDDREYRRIGEYQ